MHILIGLAAVLGVLLAWYWRFKMAREAAGELIGVAEDVRAAARRFSYRRKHKTHPIDAVEDPRLAAAGAALAIAAMDQPLSRAELEAASEGAEQVFGVSGQEAAEIAAFGRWIAGQANTEEEAVRRLTAVVHREAGPDAGPDLVTLVRQVATADGGPLGEREEQALDRIRHAFAMPRA